MKTAHKILSESFIKTIKEYKDIYKLLNPLVKRYFEMCFNDKVENYLCGHGVRKYRQIDETYHKATVQEIIEHFNKNK